MAARAGYSFAGLTRLDRYLTAARARKQIIGTHGILSIEAIYMH
jgi:hypothetical protein